MAIYWVMATTQKYAGISVVWIGCKWFRWVACVVGRVSMGILAVLLFLCGFVLCHGSGWCIVVGLACFACAVWLGAKENRAEEEDNNTYI